MREFQGKVAVVTGAASGIGRALAEKCAQEGMKVVLADVEAEALSETTNALKSGGADVRAIPTDVSRAADVEALARQTMEAYGGVHLLFNNAGVGGGGPIWQATLADWQWVLGVNLWGVIYGVHYFVPLMLEQGGEGHIVNTASMAGLTSSPGNGVYQVSKHGIVTLSESLFHDLAQQGAKIKVSVLCPGWVRTRIMEAERNRPSELKNATRQAPPPAEVEAVLQTVRQIIETATPPSQIADIVFRAVEEDKFYILPHPQWKDAVRTRMEDILQERNPTLVRAM